MIRLTINGQIVDLRNDVNFRIDVFWPDILSDTIPGPFVHWFEFDWTDNNIRIFKQANYIQVSKVKEYACTFEVDDFVFNGFLYLKEIYAGFGKACITLFDSSLLNDSMYIDELELDEIATGNTADDVLAFAKSQSENIYPTSIVCFPSIKAGNFYGETSSSVNLDFEGVINNYDFTNNQYLKNITGGNPDQKNSLVPCFYLLDVVKKVMAKAGWNLTGDVLYDENLFRLIIFNNRTLNKLTASFIIHARNNEKITIYEANQSLLFSETQFGKEYFDGEKFTVTKACTLKLSFSAEVFLEKGYTYQPYNHYFEISVYKAGVLIKELKMVIDYDEWDYITLSDSITFTNADIGSEITFKSSFYYLEGIATLVKLYRVGYILSLDMYVTELNVTEYFSFYEKILMQEHLPHLTVKDFFSNFCKSLFIIPFFDFEKRSIYLQRVEDVFNDTDYLDITSYLIPESLSQKFDDKKYFITNLINEDFIEKAIPSEFLTTDDEITLRSITPTVGRFGYVKSSNNFFNVVSISGVNNWYFFSHDTRAIEIGNSITENKIELPYTYVPSKGESMPESLIQANCRMFGKLGELSSLILLNYHGILTPALTGFTYACSSSADRWAYGYLGGLNLCARNTEGNVYKRGFNYLNYLSNSEELTAQLIPSAILFRQLSSMLKAHKSKRKVRLAGKNYLLKELHVVMSNSKVENIEIVLQ